jgi:hypothetical protein
VTPDPRPILSGRSGKAGLQRLQAELRAHARGMFRDEAAVELLIGHRAWLRRREFTGAFVETGVGLAGGAAVAAVDWAAALDALDAGGLACSSSEQQMLRIAASLADGRPLDLGSAISGLDETNTGLVAEAIWHASGHRPARR